MPDEVNTEGIDKTAEKLTKIQQSIKDTKESLSDLAGGLSGFVISVGRGATQFVRSFEQMYETTQAVSDSFGEFTEKLGIGKQLADIEGILGNVVGKENAAGVSALAWGAAIAATATAFSNLGTEFKLIDERTKSVTFQTSEYIKSLSEIAPKGSKGLLNMMTRFSSTADHARNLENSLLMATSAAGNFNDFIESTAGGVRGLDARLLKFSRTMSDVGIATGLSSTVVSDYAKSLMAIPGAMDMVVRNNDKAGTSMNMLQAAIMAARGSGKTFEDVMKTLNHVYLQFGTTGEEAIKVFTRMHEVQQDLRIPLEIVREYTHSTSSAFRFLGDNTQDSMTILHEFGKTLQDEIGPQALRELTGGFVESMSKMNIAQKAFLAGRTGGPGGLQGAFQIDLALQEGNLNEIREKVESSLRDMFGGRIVTLQEAASDARAAAQMTRQVQFLTQGPFGALVSSADQAYRLLQVMARPEAGVDKKEEIKEAFSKVMDTGDQVRERQYNATVVMQNSIAHLVTQGRVTAYQLDRIAMGTEGLLGQYINNQISKKQTSATMGNVIGRRSRVEGYTVAEDVRKSGKSITDVISDVTSAMREKADEAMRKMETEYEELNLGRSMPGRRGPEQEENLLRILGIPEPTETGREPSEIMASIPITRVPMARGEPMRNIVAGGGETPTEPAVTPAGFIPPRPGTTAGTETTLNLEVHMCPECARRMANNTKIIASDEGISVVEGENNSRHLLGMGRF